MPAGQLYTNFSAIEGNVGGTVHVPQVVRVPLVATTLTSGGAVAAWQNPEGAPILIMRVLLDLTTKSTGAANLSVGVAANGTTSSANLLDTLAVGSAAGLYDNITDIGANGKSRQKATNTQFVTVTGSADTTGLAGNLYIEYLNVLPKNS